MYLPQTRGRDNTMQASHHGLVRRSIQHRGEAIKTCATQRRSRPGMADDEEPPFIRRARAEARLGTPASADQVARSIMFRYRKPHIPHLAEREGRVHFQLRSTRALIDQERVPFDYHAHVVVVTDQLNAWLVCGALCEAIMNAPMTHDTHTEADLVLDIRLEVRTIGTMSEEWNID